MGTKKSPEITVKISLVAIHNRLVWIAVRMLVEEGLDDALLLRLGAGLPSW